MAVRLIASDLDGTLMAPDHITVTERTYNALKAAHDRGIKIAIATGRTLGFVESVIEQIPFTDYVIYSNGASVYDRAAKRDIYKNHISPEATAELLTELDKLPIYYNVYVEGKIYVQKNKIANYVNDSLPQEFLDQFIACCAQCDRLSDELAGRRAEIIAMYNVPAELKEKLVTVFKAHSLHITSSIKDEFEVTAPNVNKGTALKGLCEAAGISEQDAMCFGDALNDYEMLEAAGLAVAMGNACDKCKGIADFVTHTNADDGVAAAIEKFVLQI